MSYAQLELDVVRWGEARGIVQNGKPTGQLMKMIEEMGELCSAENKGLDDEAKDAVADIVVCLIMYCAIKDFNLVECLKDGYEVIKNRKGFLTKEGIFVKEE